MPPAPVAGFAPLTAISSPGAMGAPARALAACVTTVTKGVAADPEG